HPAQPRPARLVSFQVGDKPLDPSATYTVATNSFLAQGGDGHGVLDTSRGRKDTGLSIFELQVDHVRRAGKLAPSAELRIAPVR
ncbi:MAG: 5'-nucleotidase C-terminal domain-containing protein, partial [Planctomycetota bacterium]